MGFKRIIKFRLVLILTTFMLLISTAKGQCPASAGCLVIDTVLLDGFCFGGNGTLTIVPYDENTTNTPAYSYSIDGGLTFNPSVGLNDSVFTNISPGTYYIYAVVNVNPGCYECITITIPDPDDAIIAVTSVIQNLICHGDSTGSAQVNAIGGVMPYTYLWPTGETTDISTLLWAGTHDVIVTDANGCSVTESVVITHIYNPFSISLDTLQQVQCFGECNGEVLLTVNSGGVSPYTFDWSTGQYYFGPGVDAALNLCQGGYQVIIADAYGCDTTIAFTIVEPPILYPHANIIQHVQCFGFDDGIAFANPVGGSFDVSSDYTYSWSPISNTNDTIWNLPPGYHTVSVVDTNGCTAEDEVLITEPAELVVNFTDSVYSYCLNTNSGELCAAASGGTLGYNYAWDGDNTNLAQITPCVTNLHADIYTVTVIDANSCVASNVIDLDSVSNTFIEDSVDYMVSPVSCFDGYDGVFTINNISGGIGPFYYEWNGPGTYTSSGPIGMIDGLYAGNYSVIITDDNGCKMTLDDSVLSPGVLEYRIDYETNESCVGPNGSSCNGQIVLTITGGTSPYYYDNTFLGNFPIPVAARELVIQDTLINGLCNGVYDIHLTDDNVCEGEAYVTGGQQFIANINSETQVTPPDVKHFPSLCFNTAQGSAEIDGGPDPLLNYTWESDNAGVPSGMVIASTNTYNSFFPGDYWLGAHYANAASFWQNYVGCDAYSDFTIIATNTIDANESITNVTCSGDADGAIDLDPVGTTPFSFLWDTLTSIPYDSITNEDQSSLGAGIYTVSITDPNGCILIDTIPIWEPTPIITNIESIDVRCKNAADGEVEALADPNSGAAPFLYSWTDTSGAVVGTGGVITGLSGGTYTVTVTDLSGFGCSADFNITILEPTAILNLVEPNSFWGEDPSGTPYHIKCHGESNGSIIAANTGGTAPISYLWTPGGQTTSTATGLSAGTYTLNVTDANDCLENTTVTLKEPDLIMPTITSSEYSTSLVGITHEISCYGLYDGWSVSHPTGGYPGSQGYLFAWTNNNNEIKSLQDSAFNLPALYSYTVTVTDMNNCSQSETTTIFDQPDDFVADVTTTNYAGATHAPFTVNFIDNTISADPFDFNWKWEDDSESFPVGTISMDHEFSVNNIGLNQVYVVLTDTITHCTDTVFFTIDVQGIPDINNVFTPNSDGINDEFSFGEYAMEEVVVNIYNRWGQLVYIWEGMNKAWRGVDTNGENVPEGVYFYVLKSDGVDGHYYEKKGSVTLLR